MRREQWVGVVMWLLVMSYIGLTLYFEYEMEKYYIEYIPIIIQDGDTVWDRAFPYYKEDESKPTYNEFIYNVYQANPDIKGGSVQRGDVVLVPIKKKAK